MQHVATAWILKDTFMVTWYGTCRRLCYERIRLVETIIALLDIVHSCNALCTLLYCASTSSRTFL